MGVPERENKEREKRTESLFKQISGKNLLNMWKVLNPQIQKVNGTSNYLSQKRLSWEHIILKLSKINDKGRIIKAPREKRL